MNNMKWLLASMSKGRDVSDFFPHVVKLVSCPSLEIRKMVYTYLTHYADHDSSCRDLSLLSINAFQRDLSDSNPFIRPLALRVLTSIRVAEVLQIQILAVQTCGKDSSPHVRKCAANALAKLYPRSDADARAVLKNLLRGILMEENCTLVLSSAMVSFVEMCPEELDLLHGCFRKLCHLLTDMDEWGQIVVLDVMQRYCRTFFKKPTGMSGSGGGSAEVIDGQRRVVRSIQPDGTVMVGNENNVHPTEFHGLVGAEMGIRQGSAPVSLSGMQNNHMGMQKQKRRVVKKGFYSDEEDESLEEDEMPLTTRNSMQHSILGGVTAVPKRDVMGLHVARGRHNGLAQNSEALDNNGKDRNDDAEEEGLHEDHRLLLKSSLPLLKSRNAGVVLGVCSLHYYCGVASIRIRSALGKALVRIYHDRREIQFIVLNSIRSLVWECPSAFTPYLRDFFVKAMDPSFTRLVKLDILSALCLEPDAIDAVLAELRSYVRHHDKEFVCASIRVVGKLTEMARIVHDRNGKKTGNAIVARDQANTIALNCLSGLVTCVETSDHEDVVGECVSVIPRIMVLLHSHDDVTSVRDPNRIQEKALRKLLLLVLRSLSGALEQTEVTEEKYEETDDNDSGLDAAAILLPTDKVYPALWMLGEWLTSDSKSLDSIQLEGIKKRDIRTEILRLVANTFILMDKSMKCQALHFASKVLLTECSADDMNICEFILSLGRIDVIHDVRDIARFESRLIHMSKGIRSDSENLSSPTLGVQKITMEQAKSMLVKQKPSSSWLPIESEGQKQSNTFRFGTLSSMLSRKAGAAYIPLPAWAESDSPTSLRDPSKADTQSTAKSQVSSGKKSDGWVVDERKKSEFYDSDASTSSDDKSVSSSDSSDSSSSSSDSDESSDGSSSGTHESTSSDDSSADPSHHLIKNDMSKTSVDPPGREKIPHSSRIINTQHLNAITMKASDGDSSDTSSDDASVSSESATDDDASKKTNQGTDRLIDIEYDNKMTKLLSDMKGSEKNTDSGLADLSNGLEGLVMAPLVYDKDNKDLKESIENESSNWNIVARHDVSGGLETSIRFLRGASRQKEANLMGFNPKNAAVVCVQFKFENKRNDHCAVRRIRLMPKNVSKSNVIPTTRTYLPMEISTLENSKLSYAIVGIEFAQASDKDGAMMAKFDIKCDRGTTPIDICPPLAEMIRPVHLSRQEFDTAIEKLQGIHQQTMASFHAPLGNILVNIQEASGMMEVEGSEEHNYKLAGALPFSGNLVLLHVKWDSISKSGEIHIYCDNAMALSPLITYFMRAINCEAI